MDFAARYCVWAGGCTSYPLEGTEFGILGRGSLSRKKGGSQQREARKITVHRKKGLRRERLSCLKATRGAHRPS
jgi:hypothetical protein